MSYSYVPSTARVNIGLGSKSEMAILALGMSVHDGMSTSSYFPTPPIAMPAFLTTLSSYNVSLANASSRDIDAVIAKNQLKRQVMENLIELGNYVTLTANGDVDILLSSRFDIRKINTSSPPLEIPTNIRATDGVNLGEIVIAVDKPKYSKTFVFDYKVETVTDDAAWISINSSRSSTTIKDLAKGVTYIFRVGAVGSRGQVTYSDTTTRVAQ